MRKIEFTIGLNPVSKKNSQQIVYPKGRKPIIVQSKTYKDYEKACKQFMPKMDEPIDYPVNIRYLFYRKDKRKCDESNLIAAADDILVKYGVVLDDNYTIVVGHDGTRVFVDPNNSRTEVRITEVLPFGMEEEELEE